MQQPGGATLNALMEASGWQAHSVRGFISAVVAKKMGLAVESTKPEGGERRLVLISQLDVSCFADDSFSHLSAFIGDLVERSPVAIKQGRFPRVLLPATDNDVNILRIQLHSVFDASCSLPQV
jgi:hypothetical protein